MWLGEGVSFFVSLDPLALPKGQESYVVSPIQMNPVCLDTIGNRIGEKKGKN